MFGLQNSMCVTASRNHTGTTLAIPRWGLWVPQSVRVTAGIGQCQHRQIWWNATVGTKANERAIWPFDAGTEVEGYCQEAESCVNTKITLRQWNTVPQSTFPHLQQMFHSGISEGCNLWKYCCCVGKACTRVSICERLIHLGPNKIKSGSCWLK